MQAVSYNTYCLKRKQLMMTEEKLPSHFDVIVIGTGLEESILAGAAARNGHSVLHLDTQDYYGGDWAAFNFNGIQDWIQKHKHDDDNKNKNDAAKAEDLKDLLEGSEKVLVLGEDIAVGNVHEEWFAPKEEDVTEVSKETVSEDKGPVDPGTDSENTPDESNTDHKTAEEAPKPQNLEWTQKRIHDESRRFNLDLIPKLLFSRGSMVELLISSNISRYTEFKSVSRVLTIINGALEHVPSSRADVFSTKHISVVEKRILMKFLTFCMNYESQADKIEPFKENTFREFLKHEKLTDNLIHFVLHSIAMADETASCEEGLRATHKFLQSLGRFGNTPFLWSMYGAGEMPQAFCRLCAVFGGTYFLGRSIDGIVISDVSDGPNKAKAVITNGQRIGCSKLILPRSICPPELKSLGTNSKGTMIHREMVLTSESILPHNKEQLTFLTIPPKSPDSSSYAYVQEVGFGAAAVPKGMYCLQITSSGDEKSSIPDVRSQIVKDKSHLLWSLKFDMKVLAAEEEEGDTESGSNTDNVFLCDGPHFELDYDLNILHARKLFKVMFPGEDFLPRAPEPEEIILGGSDPAEETSKDDSENQEVAKETDTVEEAQDLAIKEDLENQEGTKETDTDLAGSGDKVETS